VHLLEGLRDLLGDGGPTGEHGRLVLHYQPQVDIQSGAVRGAEALVRWDRPHPGLLYPGAFLSLVEQHGMTMALTSASCR
jgi:sensor c-di-GMP phosphodiesterase-like protein